MWDSSIHCHTNEQRLHSCFHFLSVGSNIAPGEANLIETFVISVKNTFSDTFLFKSSLRWVQPRTSPLLSKNFIWSCISTGVFSRNRQSIFLFLFKYSTVSASILSQSKNKKNLAKSTLTHQNLIDWLFHSEFNKWSLQNNIIIDDLASIQMTPQINNTFIFLDGHW